nr:uncharacterized protein LOC115265696 [Aedes albopictus]
MNNQVFPIDDLPVEVLEHIFSFLPLSDRKSASLVCSHWEKLAFSRRFLRKVALEIRLWCKTQLTSLRRSSRRYRHLYVILNMNVRNESCFKYMLEVLELFEKDAESFQCLGHFTTEQLCLVLSRLPNLQQLVVGLNARTSDQGIEFPTLAQLQALGSLSNVLQIKNLDVPKVTQLSIVFTNSVEGKDSMPVLKRLAPQLKNVDLYSTGYFIPIEQLQFPKAEVLKIGGNLCLAEHDWHLQTFFAGFKLLKEVVLNSAIKEIALDAIINACPEIEIFKFKVLRFKPIPFHLLERLKHLKTLGLGLVYDDPEINLKCNPLVSVKTLSLELSECGEIFFARLQHLLPNVIAMDVTLRDDWEFEWGLGQICRNFSGLQRLEISDLVIRGRTFFSSLLALEQLDQLEELTLKEVHTRIVHLPSSPRLERFAINYPCWLTDGDLLDLARLYPKLRYLELGSGRQVTSKGIAAFKSQLVNCVVHCFPSGLIWSRVLTIYRDILEIPRHMPIE